MTKLSMDAQYFPAWRRVRDKFENFLWIVLCVGVIWLPAGMAVMPAGASYNPGHAYQYVLVLTLYLPALLKLVIRPASAHRLWRQPSTKWVVLLLLWSTFSILWSNAGHPASAVARNLSILLFLYAWTQVVGDREQRIWWILASCSAVMTVAAVVAMLVFYKQVIGGGRLTGFGVMQSANLAAAAMATGILWLCALPCQNRLLRAGRGFMVAILLSFVFMTFSRSVWGALFAAMLVMAVYWQGRRSWRYVALLLVFGLAAVTLAMPELTARGWSMRPEILQRSWELFVLHPWRGLGQGAIFHFDIDGMVLTHAHNMFSQLAIELGLPGLLLWLGIWFALGWQSWRHRHEPLGRLVLAIWVLASITTQFDLPHLIDSPRPSWLMTWLLLAMSYSLHVRSSPAGSTES